MTEVTDLRTERARRGKLGNDEWTVEDALKAALDEVQGGPESWAFEGNMVKDVYIAFRTEDDEGREFFPHIASSASRLHSIGLLTQHIYNECDS